MTRTGWRRVGEGALLGVVCAALPACITFDETEGVDIADADVAAIRPGETTRREVLERLGPPTGVFRTRLLDAFLRDASFTAPSTPGRVDDDVLVWQKVTIEGRLAFFPVLFAWASSKVGARTLMVIFDEDDHVSDVAFREDVE